MQLLLPSHIDPEKITLAISPDKDVDGFHPENIGRMVLGLDCSARHTERHRRAAALPSHRNGRQTRRGGGRSHIVGAPMSILLSRNAHPGNCTVTLAQHERIASITRQADIPGRCCGEVPETHHRWTW